MDIVYKLAIFLSRLIGLYSTVIVIRIMLTWLPLQNQNGPVITFMRRLCDPYLNLFKSRKTVVGRMDFSPLIALMVLNVLQSIFTMLATYGHITIGIIIALLLQGMWQYLFSYIFIILLVMIGIRWFVGRNVSSPKATAFINSVEPILYKPVHFVYNLFYKGKNTNDQTIVLTAFFFYLALFIGAKYGINYLIGFLCRL